MTIQIRSARRSVQTYIGFLQFWPQPFLRASLSWLPCMIPPARSQKVLGGAPWELTLHAAHPPDQAEERCSCCSYVRAAMLAGWQCHPGMLSGVSWSKGSLAKRRDHYPDEKNHQSDEASLPTASPRSEVEMDCDT